ncbi:MAG: FtsX-like permease family protein [Bacteroidota bacterium]
MIKNYLLIAFRNAWRHKGYAFINLLGLSIGLACSFIIFLWIEDETKVNRFHENQETLFQAKRHVKFTDGQVFTWGSVTQPMSLALEKEYPEVAHAEMLSWKNEMILREGEQAFRQEGRYADSAFFEIFSFPFIMGDPTTALDDPSSIVITEKLAEKYYGADWREKDILGSTFTVSDIFVNNEVFDYKLTGVCENVSKLSTIEFEFILPTGNFYKQNEWVSHWGNSGMQMFIQTIPGVELAGLNEKIVDIISRNQEGSNAEVFLQPLSETYLYGRFDNAVQSGGRIEYVRIFLIVALFILIIASINFMNLATARSGKRAREIGVRKAVGANKSALFSQFMGESLIMSGMAMIVAVLIVHAILPFFNELTDKEIFIDYTQPHYILGVLGITIFMGVLSGLYPAIFLSSFETIQVLKGTLKSNLSAAQFRKVLVVFQFSLSILLIIGTITVFRQVDYIRTKNLGMDRDNLVYFNWEGGLIDGYERFKRELTANPAIDNVTLSSQNPLSVGNSTQDPSWEGKDPDATILFNVINTEYDFISTMRMTLKDDTLNGINSLGSRDFSPDFTTDSTAYIINEQSAKVMGMESPLGKTIDMWGQKGQIIGVVNDFHFSSFYETIDPLIIRFDPENTFMIGVRLAAGATPEGLAHLQEVYQRYNPEYPFKYRFLDESYEEMYQSEILIGKLANYFSIVAIIISCLGLFGLASFTAEQRTKELGIRKVLGASVSNLVILLTRDFTWLVLIAFVIAAPVAFYFLNDWLSKFEFRIAMGPGVFVGAAVLTLFIAWLTISYQSLRAATANPVESIRSE